MGLDEASQALFIDNNPEIMVAILKQLHELIAEPPATPSERVFIQAYGATLTAAEGHLRRYIELRDTYKQQLRLYRSTEPSGSGNNIRRSNSRGGGASVATSEHEQGSKDGSQSPRKRGQGRPLPEFQMDLATRSMWELYLKVFRPINKYVYWVPGRAWLLVGVANGVLLNMHQRLLNHHIRFANGPQIHDKNKERNADQFTLCFAAALRCPRSDGADHGTGAYSERA